MQQKILFLQIAWQLKLDFFDPKTNVFSSRSDQDRLLSKQFLRIKFTIIQTPSLVQQKIFLQIAWQLKLDWFDPCFNLTKALYHKIKSFRYFQRFLD